ncbi:hypothetical protein DXG01_013804 [Tephrocybe rancida]|nr:hypothetical protein DXG01_013804 [Tephrocybe rancida]
MLLLPRSHDQFAGKSALLESWVQFGSIARPPWMVAADDAIWNVLLAATCGGDVVAHVKDALTILQPVVGGSTPAWFKLVSGKAALNECVPSTSREDDVDSDSEQASAITGPGLSLLSPQSAIPCSISAPRPCSDADGAALSSALSDAGPPPHSPIDVAPASALNIPPAAPLPVQPIISVPSATLSETSTGSSIIQTGADPSADPPLSHGPPGSAQLISTSATDSMREETVDIQPAARRSARTTANMPEAPYPASSGVPRKRKKQGKLDVKEVATPLPVRAQRNPEFIDLTLEDSDNEV